MLRLISQLFTEIGLDEDAAKIYLYILSNSPAKKNNLQKRFYCLNHEMHIQQLLAIPLITFDLDRNMETIYYALKPDQALKALADQELWNHTIPTHQIPASEKQRIKLLVDCINIGKKLLPKYNHRSSIGLNSIRIARDPAQLTSFLCETITIAQSEIFAVSIPPLLPKLALIWNELKLKIESGVTYNRIVDLWEMGFHGFEIKRRDVFETGVKLHLIDRKNLERKFYLIDDRWLVLFRPDMSKVNGYNLDGQIIKNKSLATKFKSYFNDLLENSISAQIVLDYMAIRKKQLLEQAVKDLDDTGFTWLKTLIDYGNFSEWPELTKTKKDIIIEVALKKGLVIKDSDFSMGVSPNYNWSFDDIKEHAKTFHRGN